MSIHRPVLSSPYQNTRETFGLYEQADWKAFLGALAQTQPRHRQKPADFYNRLGRTFRSSVDLNNLLTHPNNHEDFLKCLEIFHRSFDRSVRKFPQVALARKAYEKAFETIRDPNGIIPKAAVLPDKDGISRLDLAAEAQFLQNFRIQPYDTDGLQAKYIS